MKKLYTATQTISKILETCHWIGACVLLVAFVLTMLPGETFLSMAGWDGTQSATLTTYGFEMAVFTPDGALSKGALQVFTLGAALILALMAMVFRNIYLILKTARGETKFSKGATPFQEDITRMIREIGFFFLGTVAISWIFSTIAGITVGFAAVESTIDVSTIMVGMLMLCLSHAFEQGTALQRDADGLV